MKLYHMPGACSLGIHVLLEEIGKPYSLEKVDFSEGAQYKPAFVALNPKSRVPALLRDDNTVLTEFPAIAFYLARCNPEKNLMPATIEGEARTLELLDYLIATMHMRGYTRIFRPAAFTTNAAEEDAVKQAGREIVQKGFALIAPQLGDQEYILGPFSIVEAALFFLEFWAVGRAKIALPDNLQAHFERLMARPAVQRALAAEGLA